MRFLPIHMENVSNAATLFVKLQNIPPKSQNWTYSSAYARLSAEIKTVGFEGYIVFYESGSPAGFLLGHSEVREDGKSDFFLRELCFEWSEQGDEAARAALSHLAGTLAGRCIDTILILAERTPDLQARAEKLGFAHRADLVCLQKTCE